MVLTFRYPRYRSPNPVVPLGGVQFRPQPVILIGVTGPLGTLPYEALIDTGADDTIFPLAMAASIGLDLSTAPTGTARGVGGTTVLVRYVEVGLRLAQGSNRIEWRAWAGFVATPMRRGLLGFAGFLQFFTATFRGDREEVELEANALLPGP
jgi:Aspartyl protease